MKTLFNAEIDELNSYFAQEHSKSFELLGGEGAVMFSAPHSVQQTRNGIIKTAEPQTGVLAKLLNGNLNCPVIYKTKNCNDDANYDKDSVYKKVLAKYVTQNGIRFLIDLHQLSPLRPMDVNIGVANYKNVDGKTVPNIIAEEFNDRGICGITVDTPYKAAYKYTVSSYIRKATGIQCVQIELNSKLLFGDLAEEYFIKVYDALRSVAIKLNELTGDTNEK